MQLRMEGGRGKWVVWRNLWKWPNNSSQIGWPQTLPSRNYRTCLGRTRGYQNCFLYSKFQSRAHFDIFKSGLSSKWSSGLRRLPSCLAVESKRQTASSNGMMWWLNGASVRLKTSCETKLIWQCLTLPALLHRQNTTCDRLQAELILLMWFKCVWVLRRNWLHQGFLGSNSWQPTSTKYFKICWLAHLAPCSIRPIPIPSFRSAPLQYVSVGIQD